MGSYDIDYILWKVETANNLMQSKKYIDPFKLDYYWDETFHDLTGTLHSTKWNKLFKINLIFMEIRLQFDRFFFREYGHLEVRILNYKFYRNW